MYQFNLFDIPVNPWRYFITKIALPVKNNGSIFLFIDIAGNASPVNNIDKIYPFVIRVS